jgi:hypothetical protein
MAYGEIKVDTVTFTDGGIDKSVSISGLVQNPTFSGNITVTGTISGNTVQGQTVSGATVTGTTANFVSGVFTTQISGATITGNVGSFTTITGGTVTLTSGVFASGTAAAPSVSIGTTDNGLYSPGADQVAVATNGTGRLFVDASGNVGVGTSSVNALLEVNNSTAGGEVQRIEGNYDGSGSVTLTNWRRAGGSVAAAFKYNDDSSPLCMSIGTTTSHEFRIRTADTDAITIDTSQRVGIGTSSPQQFLHIHGTNGRLQITSTGTGSASGDGALFGYDGSNDLFINNRESTNFKVFTAGTQALTVDSSQRVGIGTASPGYALDVKTSAETACRLDSGSGNNAILRFAQAGVNKAFINYQNGGGLTFGPAGSEAARIDSSGRLGIGTSSPGYLLDIQSTSATLRIKNTTVPATGGTSSLLFEGINNFSGTSQSFINSIQAGNSGATQLTFGTSGSVDATATERLRITSAGLVGIGTSSPSTRLHLNSADASANYLRVENTGGYAFFGIDSSATAYAGAESNNAFGLVTNGSYRTYITAGGNVGIGTTSPSEALHVKSTSGTQLVLERDGTTTQIASVVFKDGSGDQNRISSSDSNLIFESGAGNTERARIDSSGRLLVGTSTSAGYHLLQIQGNTNSPLSNGSIALRRGQTNPGIEVLGEVVFTDAAGSRGASIEATTDLQWNNNDYPTRLTFSTTADGASSPTERMRITSGGNVGIGTTSPGVPLEVNGNARASNFSVPDTNFIGFGSYTAYLSGSSASNFINFSTGSTERARIDSSGRLLVGTSSGTSRLSIAGTADNANSEIQITATGIASGYIGANSNGLNIGTDTAGLVFKTGVTGGGSVGASGTERMRIDNSGRLLVGTSSARSNVYRGASSLISPVQIDSNANSYSNGINVLNYSGSGYGSVFTLGLSLSNTQGTNTVVRNNDELGYLNFVGNDGTNFRTGAWIGGEVDGTPGAGDMPGRLVFSTTADGAASPTERMRIGQNGLSYFFSSGSTVIYAGSSSAAGTTNNILQGGHSATSTTAALTSFVVHNNGNVLNTNNSYGSLSDIKLKENIVDASSQWDDLKDLKVRNYNFKEGQTHTQIGLVAQEVELVSPGLVSESPDRDEDGNDLGTVTKSVNYSVLYMKAVKALQEAMERIEQLEAKVAALETK